MPKNTRPLTKKQKSVLDFISTFASEHGYSPSLKEIAGFVETDNLSTAQYYVEELESRGYLKRDSFKTRGITTINKNGKVQLLGVIAAGKPIEPIENPEAIEVPKNIKLKPDHSYYALRVKGDSMMDMGILDNDVVLIKHQMTADDRDVVVGVTEKGATLKVYREKGNQVFLEARNNNFPTIQPKELEIRGKFIGLIRNNI